MESGPGPPEIRSYDDVVRYVAARVLDEYPDRVVGGLAVDLEPIFKGIPPGNEHVRLNQMVGGCVEEGWLRWRGGSGREVVFTPIGARYASEILAEDEWATEQAALSQPTSLAKRFDTWVGEQRELFPHLSPLLEKALVAAVAWVFGLLVGLWV